MKVVATMTKGSKKALFYITFGLRPGRHGSINCAIAYWTAWSSRDMCVNWNEPQASRLQLHEQPSALTTLEYTSWWMQTEISKRSE